jgi:hypothetical protein
VTEPIELEFTLRCSPEHAFGVWTGRVATWWPSAHTMSRHPDVVDGWERLGAFGAEWRRTNRLGWAGVLPDYRRVCAATT